MRKQSRLQIRWSEPDAHLATLAAQWLDMSVSELVRRATVEAAIGVLQGGEPPPPTATAGRADGRSARAWGAREGRSMSVLQDLPVVRAELVQGPSESLSVDAEATR